MGKHKYGAKKITIDGITFDSKAEGKRYSELKMLEKAGEISHLALQPKFRIVVENMLICDYYADFAYVNKRGERCIEDVKGEPKGAAHSMFMLKWRLALAQYRKKIERWYRVYSDQTVEGLEKRKNERIKSI